MINYISTQSAGAAKSAVHRAHPAPHFPFFSIFMLINTAVRRSWSAVGSSSVLLLPWPWPGHAQSASAYLCIYVSNQASAMPGPCFPFNQRRPWRSVAASQLPTPADYVRPFPSQDLAFGLSWQLPFWGGAAAGLRAALRARTLASHSFSSFIRFPLLFNFLAQPPDARGRLSRNLIYA